ncbi:GH20903 [Drosophila grimshawi]|uniref:GH20903 n=1 Tax=Drosophila grimshawi TaxID=7222 RepID=B4J4U4_DROGR|nr:GH20903 [Drosophila grimshawi]
METDGLDDDTEKKEMKEKEDNRPHTNLQNSNDIITYSASASLSHSLSLGSVNEKSYQSNPTTAAEDNNCARMISRCKPLKFPLASEWLV